MNSCELIQSVIYNNIDKVSDLIAAGADVNSTDDEGCSALMWAWHLGNIEIVRLLIEKGADVSQIDFEGFTPVESAIITKNLDETRLLIESGCDVVIEQDGFRLMDIAAAVGSVEIGQLLLDKGVALDNNDSSGLIPLFTAIQRGHTNFCRFLLDNGARINIEDESGLTPLSQAVAGGHLEIVRLLIERGADVNYVNEHGTALHFAFAWNQLEIIDLLDKSGARFDVKAEDGHYPIWDAVDRRHKDVIRKYAAKYKDILTDAEKKKLMTLARRRRVVRVIQPGLEG